MRDVESSRENVGGKQFFNFLYLDKICIMFFSQYNYTLDMSIFRSF